MFTAQQLGENLERALVNLGLLGEGKTPAQLAAKKIARALDELSIPYVVAGGLAVAAHGLQRTTEDVDLILTKAGLEKFKAGRLGLGWVERFKGSRSLTDAEYSLRVDILTTGDKPGDGTTCPFTFPEPAMVGETLGGIWGGIRVLDLRTLIELKLAAGKTARHRLRDLDDVLRLIKIHGLGRDYGLNLHEFVRDKYEEVWLLAQEPDPYEER